MRKQRSRPRSVPARLLPFRSPPDTRGQDAGRRPRPAPAARTGQDGPARPAPPRRLTSLAGFFRRRDPQEVFETEDDR